MQEFGLVPVDWPDPAQAVYLRGALSSPYIYVGEQSDTPAMKAIGIEVESMACLVQASRMDGASGILALDRPGGGHCVALTLPGGIRLELVHGIAPLAELPVQAPLTLNQGLSKARYNQPQRPPRRAPQVPAPGACGAVRARSVQAKEWAVQHLGMIVSDAMRVPGSLDQYIGFFMRWNHGAQPTDHSLLIAAADRPLVHHISFELQDMDAVFMGHEWLRQQGHSPHWGWVAMCWAARCSTTGGIRMASGWSTTRTAICTTTRCRRAPWRTNEQLWTWGPAVPDTFSARPATADHRRIEPV
jgi:hypothetical protein